MSIFCIVMLGTAFFAGLRSTGGDMKYSADRFYDDNRLMDIRLVSTLGLSQEDIDDLTEISGVLVAKGGKSREVLLQTEDASLVIRLIAVTEGVNEPVIREGRLPQNEKECFLDYEKFAARGYQIGDTIHFDSGDDEELTESLTGASFTIVGSGYLPYYTDLTRGTGSIGDGTIDAFVLLDPSAFTLDYYTEAYLRVEGADQERTFSDSYDRLVDEVSDRIDVLSEAAVIRRYDQVYQEGLDAIADARKKVSDGEKELTDAASEIADGHQAIADAEKEISDKEQELADGRQQIQDGRQELADAQAQIDSGREALAAAEQTVAQNSSQLEEAKSAYQDGLDQYQAGKDQYEEGKAAYEAGRAELEDAKKAYEDGLAQYEAGLSEYQDGLDQYQAGKDQYEEGKAAYEEGKAKYEAGLAALAKQASDYEVGKAAYEAGAADLADQQAAYETGLADLEGQQAEYDAGVQAYQEALAQLEAAEAAGLISEEEAAATRAALVAREADLAQAAAALETARAGMEVWQAGLAQAAAQLEEAAAGIKEYEMQKIALDAAGPQLAEKEKELEAAKDLLAETGEALAAAEKELAERGPQLEAAQQELEAGEQRLAASKAQLDEAATQLASSEARLAQAAEQIASGESALAAAGQQIEGSRADLISGQNQITASTADLAEAQAQLEDGQAQLADGKAELSDKKAELADAEKEYQEALPDAEKELADARDQIADGEKELEKLEVPEWYVLDRSMMESIIGYEQNADRMDNLGTVFPVIFFLVAALVSLTAMTRMVDEQRMQIGTMKALGYSGGVIAGRYLLYALLATVGGSILGIAFGEWFLPRLIIQSYGVMYTGQLYCFMPVNWHQAILGLGAACLCTGGATLAACLSQLRENPASLMRPQAPPAGQRVFLERIPFLWRHLSFTRKSTVRNLVRYKKRLVMTIIGVGGCMGLLLVGFGIHDSINEIAKQQYIHIFKQDATITMASSSSAEERTALQELVDAYPGVTGSEQVGMVSVDLTHAGNLRGAYLYIPRDTASIGDYLSLRSRTTGEPYSYPEEGAIITEKTAKMLDLAVGDEVTIVRDGEKNMSVKVTAISENYILHYLFLSPQTYRELYGKEPDYNSLYLHYGESVLAEESAFGSYLMRQEACAGVGFTTDLEAEIDDMLAILGNIVLVLIVAAGLLAFVVLYNLNSINIMERRRELATLKVLGFFDTEVAAYVYRENVLLTILGAALGLVIGAVLHRFVIVTVEVDLMMFGRNISPQSYLYSTLITFAFAVIVNFVMYFSLKKVDMIESLKSVE